MALVTLDIAKEHLGIDLADSDFDARITRYINSASEAIENFLDRKVESASYVQVFDGNRGNRILVKQWPVTAVASVYVDSGHDFADASTLLDPSDYRVREEGEIILMCSRYPKGTWNIQVSYTAGFATVPPSIENACLWIVEWYHDMQGDRRVGNKSKGKNNETTTYLTDWPEWLKGQLMPYRRSEWATANAPIDMV